MAGWVLANLMEDDKPVEKAEVTPEQALEVLVKDICDEAEWAMEYGRLRLNTTARIDDLALSVLKGVTNDIEYVWKEDNELHNLLRLKIKNVEIGRAHV